MLIRLFILFHKTSVFDLIISSGNTGVIWKIGTRVLNTRITRPLRQQCKFSMLEYLDTQKTTYQRSLYDRMEPKLPNQKWQELLHTHQVVQDFVFA